MKKVNVFQMLLLGVISLFFSCKNQFYLTELTTPAEDCRLSFSIGDVDRTIQGTLTWTAIGEIDLFKDGDSLASWKSDDNQTAYQKMTSDDSILLEPGIYDFNIDLKNDDKTVVASGSLLQKKIEPGLNSLIFTTEQQTEGLGDICLTFSWDKGESVTKAVAALYTFDNVKINNTEITLVLETEDDNTVATYELSNISSGIYIYKLKLYDTKKDYAGTISENPVEILTKTCADAIIVENGLTSNAEITVTGINIQNQITYVLNGGSWVSGYVPPFIFNESSTIELPTRSKITKTSYMLSGWYDNPELKGEEVYKLSDETRGNITLYAKWIKASTNIVGNTGETIYFTGTSVPKKNTGPFIEWEVTGTSIQSNRNCEVLKKVITSNKVTSIETNAFLDCSNLEEVVLGTGITQIKTGTFSRCANLKKVTIPPTVKSIGDWAFDLDFSLEEILIPDSVTTLGHSVFQSCKKLEKVKLSKNLQTIGYLCFDNCPSLKSITIPASVTSIDTDAFRGCDSLTEVIYEGTLEQWLKIQFKSPMSNPCYYARKLICNGKEVSGDIVIPDSITTLSGYTFISCDGITSITIPASVTSIGPAFATGKHIQSIKVDSENSKYNSRDNCNGIIETSRNTLISGAKITTIPESVQIDPRAYAGCYDIEVFDFPPSIKTLDNNTCSYLPGVKEIIIPNTVTKISDCAFVGCIGLENVEIPNSVTEIGNYAFACCKALKEVTVPSSVTSVYDRAFYGCTSLKTVVFQGSNTSLSYQPFRNCINLEEVSLPSNLTNIGTYCFYGCEKLKTINLPSSTKYIENQAFYYCTGLETITIPNNVIGINSKAFKGCSSLRSIEFENTTGWKFSSEDSYLQYDASDPTQNAQNLSSNILYYFYYLSRT